MPRQPALFWLPILLALCSGLLHAQTAQTTPEEGPLYTLKVNEILIQIPVLVASPFGRRVPPVDPHKFTLSLNGGRAITPSHVRPQGEDPITLALLIDAGSGQEDLFPTLAASVAALVPGSLHPQDKVAIYALGCQLTRLSPPITANADLIARQITLALSTVQDRKQHGCGSAKGLWGSMAFIIHDLAHEPSRHVLLALTAGYSEAERFDSPQWVNLKNLAQSTSTALFALREDSTLPVFHLAEGHLNSICNLSGGLLIKSFPSKLPATLVDFLALFRERYILDFRRPGNLPPGQVSLDVKLKHSSDLVLPAGVSVPIEDPAQSSDPNLFHPDPSLAPEVGPRKPLKTN